MAVTHIWITRDENQAKVEKTMHEFGEGQLHSGSKSGPVVKNKKQAIAIALNQARGDAKDYGVPGMKKGVMHVHPDVEGHGRYAKAHQAATKKGFQYQGPNAKGQHSWAHPSGASLTVSHGGIGRSAGDPIARVKTGPSTEHTHQHQWPETAVRGALKKAGH
jgi:hypothetical protein